MNQTPKDIYKKIIHVKECLKKERKLFDIYGVIDYVFNEYIKQENVERRQNITKKILKEIDETYKNNELDLDLCVIPIKEIELLQEYIHNNIKLPPIHRFNIMLKLQMMKNNVD
jgi:hypothetical protein